MASMSSVKSPSDTANTLRSDPPCPEEPSARSTVQIRVSAGSIAITRASNAEASRLVT
jgi:hypothetical protein